LRLQRSHSQLAEEKGLYLVEQRQDFQNFPLIVAEPSRCRTESEITYDEPMDFSQVSLRLDDD